MPARLKTVTLGCKVNQYETQYVREGLLQVGYVDASAEQTADLCVVNTCTVTNEGDSKSRQVIRRLHRENPQARIVVMGCYATRAPEQVAELPGVAEVVTDKRELPDLLGRFGVVDLPTGISEFGDRRRAYVKVQDGCMLRCSYCIIPHVRPQLTSRPVDHVLQEVKRLVANGHREIVLTGVHLGHYGVDWNWKQPKESWYRLSDLLRTIAELPGRFRVRLSSIEATELTRELIAVMADHADRVCPHIHLCLQSGADSVLRRMRRRWGVRRFLDRCRMLREALDDPAITTDVIVGFPGETDDEFQQTLQTCRTAGFSKIHVFPFSARRGTPAAEFPDQVHGDIRKARCRRLMELEHVLRAQYFDSLLGRRLQVMLESRNDAGAWTGTSCRYAPVEIQVPDDRLLLEAGQLVDVHVQRREHDRLIASLVDGDGGALAR